jgi:molecular chaperone GrpE
MKRDRCHKEAGGKEHECSELLRKRVSELESELSKREREAEEYKNLAQRLQADFENHIKRAESDRVELRKTASRDLILKLVDILDTMEYALDPKHAKPDCEKAYDGFGRVFKQFKSILEAEGLETVSNDGIFDHSLHEVVDSVSDSTKPAGTIAEVIQKGYKLGGRLIRTSKVIVVSEGKKQNG